MSAALFPPSYGLALTSPEWGVAVRQSPALSGKMSVADRSDVAENVICYLRDRFPVKTAEHVAADTGIKCDTVQKWLDRASLPNGWSMLRLIAAYGPEFLAAGFESAPLWLAKAVREEQLQKLEAEIAALEREKAALTTG